MTSGKHFVGRRSQWFTPTSSSLFLSPSLSHSLSLCTRQSQQQFSAESRESRPHKTRGLEEGWLRDSGPWTTPGRQSSILRPPSSCVPSDGKVTAAGVRNRGRTFSCTPFCFPGVSGATLVVPWGRCSPVVLFFFFFFLFGSVDLLELPFPFSKGNRRRLQGPMVRERLYDGVSSSDERRGGFGRRHCASIRTHSAHPHPHHLPPPLPPPLPPHPPHPPCVCVHFADISDVKGTEASLGGLRERRCRRKFRGRAHLGMQDTQHSRFTPTFFLFFSLLVTI